MTFRQQQNFISQPTDDDVEVVEYIAPQNAEIRGIGVPERREHGPRREAYR